MRFIHTADWHLGRLFHGVRLTDDQSHVIDQFIDLVAEVRPAAVLVAGDIYDRGVPPTEAVDLLDDTLQRIVRGLGVPVVAIAGNHDSAARLGFGARLLADQGLHIAGPVEAEPLRVTFADDSGAVCVVAIPYADPVETRAALSEDGIHDHQAALQALVARARGQLPAGARHLLMTHAFVAGSLTSDSERPLSVGGAGQVTADVFEGFDYVALGHLHRPQSIGAGALRYSGSLLKYSFLEADHDKSVTIVDVDPSAPGKAPSLEPVRLAPRHDVRVIEGRLADLVSAGRTDPHDQDYVCARLLDKGAILDPIGQLREVYANVLTIDRSALDLSGERSPALADPGSRSESEHFAAFFAYCTGDELEPAEDAALSKLLNGLEREWRSS